MGPDTVEEDGMSYLLSAATGVLVVASLLPLWRNPHWLVRGLEFPRLQLTLLAVVLLALQTALLDVDGPIAIMMLAATVACLLWQLWWIAPYTPLWPKEVRTAGGSPSDRDIRVLTANVLMANRDADRLIAVIRDTAPDVVVTLESDLWWQSRLEVLHPDFPHRVACPLDNTYGMHVYSRLPLLDSEIAYLVEDDKPSVHASVALRSGDHVRMHFLHPAPPSPTENEESGERDAELIVVARSVAGASQPVIVTGDLNDVAWSPSTRLFRKISGLSDPRVGRGMFNTFHAKVPLARWPLDHVFHSSHFTLRSIRRLPPIGSDHFALFVELSFTPASTGEQGGLDADAEDVAEARDVTDRHRVHPADVPRPQGDV